MLTLPRPLLVLALALALDLVLGEPPAAAHPVVWMGSLMRGLRRRAPRAPAPAFVYGLGLALLGPLLFGLGSWALLARLHPYGWLGLAVEAYLFKSAFAVRELGRAARRVGQALVAGELHVARAALRSLVSRDTTALGTAHVAAAAIESVAENTSDSFVAPLCCFVVAGVPGALAYRAINTLDSLIGYHGETEWLGKAAARLDDVANWIPARLTAACLVLAAPLTGASATGALRCWRRDGASTESPNAGRPMAAMAGALGLELEKIGHYCLGRGGALPGAGDIGRALAVFAVACGLASAGAAALLGLVAHG